MSTDNDRRSFQEKADELLEQRLYKLPRSYYVKAGCFAVMLGLVVLITVGSYLAFDYLPSSLPVTLGAVIVSMVCLSPAIVFLATGAKVMFRKEEKRKLE